MHFHGSELLYRFSATIPSVVYQQLDNPLATYCPNPPRWYIRLFMWFSDHQGKKTAKMNVPAAAETNAELEEADEIEEIKRQAAAEVEAEKEKAEVCCFYNTLHSLT